MSETPLRLSKPPIIEAVIEIRCDMGPTFDLATFEGAARDVFRDQYPKLQQQFVEAHRLEREGDEPPRISAPRGLQALQFLHADGKQLVQIRMQGFTFNRLAPYSSLDDYLPEIERTWRLFVQLATPVQIQQVRMRYINRILLPLTNRLVELTDFLEVGPRLPDEDRLHFTGFLNQHAAVEVDTGNLVNIISTLQPLEKDLVPLILDIEVIHVGAADPGDWISVRSNIDSLRSLKNHVFKNTLTQKCLNLF
jgi:uncharacterized protein (TIGR04255 family)